MQGLGLTLAILTASVHPASGETITGKWETSAIAGGYSGIVLVQACGAAYCGHLLESLDSQGRSIATPLDGKPIFWAMKDTGNGSFVGGRIFSPEHDRDFAARFQLTGDRLNITGCWMGICQSGGSWTRAK